MTSRTEPVWKISDESMPGWKGMVVIAFCSLLLLYMVPTLSGIFGEIGPRVEPEVIFMGMALVALVVFVVWHNERFWLYGAILSHSFMLLDSQSGIGLGELAFAVIVLGGLVVWFAKELLTLRHSIVRSGFDVLLLGFLCLSTVIALVALYFHGGDTLWFFKEWAVLFELLLYFPIRKNMQTREDVLVLLLLYIVLACGNGILNLMTYRSRLLSAVYMWEIESSRTTANTPLSTGLFILFATVFAYAKQRRIALVAIAGTAVALLFSVIGFSRGPIIGGLFGIVVLIVMVPLRSAKRVVAALLSSIIIGGIIIYSFYPSLTNSFAQSLIHRLATVSSGTADLSLRSRLSESESLLFHYIPASPILGYGFGSRFTFFDPISHVTTSTTFIHDGYIWPLFKFGIPITVMFFFLLAYPFLRLLIYKPRRERTFNHALMAGTVGYMAAAMLTNFTSSQFEDYAATFNIAFCWALLDYINRHSGQDTRELFSARGV